MSRPPSSTSAGMRRTPPTPTLPMKNPTTTATATSSARATGSTARPSARGEGRELARQERGQLLHQQEARAVVALHEVAQPPPVDRHHLAFGEAIGGGDAPG